MKGKIKITRGECDCPPSRRRWDPNEGRCGTCSGTIREPTVTDLAIRIWQHFCIQARPPGWDNEIGTCVYRTAGGCMCAVGVTIPDWAYSPRLERHNLQDLIDLGHLPPKMGEEVDIPAARALMRAAPWLVTHQSFLMAVQGNHDSAAKCGSRSTQEFTRDFTVRLRQICVFRGIDLPESPLPGELAHVAEEP